MGKSNSKFLNFVKKYPYFRKFYYLYNIYIRNFKSLNGKSQMGEDKEILKLFKKDYKGNYVDIGCYHPTNYSNTHMLYKKGWRGLNIDLNPLSIELFNVHRPNDINLNLAISNDEGFKNLYFLDDLNTQNTLELNHIEFLKTYHGVKSEEIEIRKVQTHRLDKVLDQYNFKKIDFLNIDVEGHEINIIKSINFNKYEIKVICIEILNHNKKSELINRELKEYILSKDYIISKKIGLNYIFYKNEKK